MLNKKLKHWDPQLGEMITTRERCTTGFCHVCGEPNYFPKKFRRLYICKGCYRTRLDDAIEIDKAIEDYESELEKNKKEGKNG